MQNKLKILSILSFSISFISLVFLCFYHKTFWFDEAYSIGMIKLSFGEIWRMTAHDVHPPLYYFILKIFTSIFGQSLASMHICSLVPIVLMILLGLYPVKRLFGADTAYMFIILISLLPVTLFFAIEIRMYSWLAFFVLATSVYGYDAIINTKSVSYIKLTFFAICASYTHNYGLASVLTIYFLLWVTCIKKNKRILSLIISTITFIAIFSIWIPSLYLQLSLVKNQYWIELLTLREFLTLPLFFVGGTYRSIFILGLFISFLCIIYLSICNRKEINKKKIESTLFFILIFVIIYFTTGILSLLYKPILISRYLISTFGCLTLGISILLSSTDKISKKLLFFYFVIFICTLSLCCLQFVEDLKKYTLDNKKSETLIEYFNKNIESTTNKYSIIGSADQKFIISTLYTIKPKNEYYFYYTKDDRATTWAPYPFLIDEIYSLEDVEDTIFIINDLDRTFTRNQFKKSLESLKNDAILNFNTIRVDTIDNVEIKLLYKK